MTGFPSYEASIPSLTTEQMVEVDRLMIEEAEISLLQMMENAGRNLAHLARIRFLGGEPRGRAVTVLAGTGGNGGGALVCARRLHSWGAAVRVVVRSADESFASVPAHQLRVVRRMGIEVVGPDEVVAHPEPELIVDGVIGYSLRGAPRGPAASLIRWANAAGAPTLSLDVPSGIDTTTGVAHDPSIRAAATMTLALPKQGLRSPGVVPQVGELYLADISVPPELYASPSLGLAVPPIFSTSDIVRLPAPSA